MDFRKIKTRYFIAGVEIVHDCICFQLLHRSTPTNAKHRRQIMQQTPVLLMTAVVWSPAKNIQLHQPFFFYMEMQETQAIGKNEYVLHNDRCFISTVLIKNRQNNIFIYQPGYLTLRIWQTNCIAMCVYQNIEVMVIVMEIRQKMVYTWMHRLHWTILLKPTKEVISQTQER